MILKYSITIIANKDISNIVNIALEYLVSSTCVLRVNVIITTLKLGLLIRVVDAYLLCVLNPIAIFCDILHT